jgi:hypothetical protein
MLRIWGSALAGLLIVSSITSAENYYVDNLNGRDRNDGLTDVPLNSLTGPVKSVRRALELAGSGDSIFLTNTGVPYYESISLVGLRHSGVLNVPTTIYGNGATLSGLRGLPRQGWRQVNADTWEIRFTRKGFYRLLRDGFPLPEHRPDDASRLLESLPPGQWGAARGSVYFRQDGLEDPTMQRFDYAAGEVGITLYQVEHVRIEDLNVEHFRLDGVHAQNMCRDITLSNVTSRENGRAGLAVGGTSSVQLRNGRLEGNGRDSALVTGKGLLEVVGSQIDVEPTVRTE